MRCFFIEMNFFYIIGTVVFTVYGQLILKWRISDYGTLPVPFVNKVIFLIKLVADPFILSGFLSAFIASLFWMGAMTKFDLSFAYPFMSASFVLVFLFSILLFNEPFSFYKVLGLFFIVLGIVITSRA